MAQEGCRDPPLWTRIGRVQRRAAIGRTLARSKTSTSPFEYKSKSGLRAVFLPKLLVSAYRFDEIL